MTSLTGRTSRAAALHRRAAATASAATTVLDAVRPAPADQRRQYELADRLRSAAALLAPGWAGAALEDVSVDVPPLETTPPFVRIGTAAPLDDARFPALVPLLGTANLSIDVDARDVRVAGLLRAVLLRLLAASPPGTLLARVVDGLGTEGTFAGFGGLGDVGLLPPPAADLAGLRTVLTEAEQWTAPSSGGRRRHDRSMLLLITGWPEGVESADLDRVEALAVEGPAAGLHLVVAGWPPPPPVTEGLRAPLALATPILLRNSYALLGDPPGTTFSRPGNEPSTGLNSPVFVEDDPAPALVDAVCRRLAEQLDARTRLSLADLLPDSAEPLWQETSATGMSVTVGDANGRPVPLGLTDLTPHWLVSGRPGAGKSAFLANVLFGLAARYGPDEFALHLVDLADGESFTEYLQTVRDRSWLPQVRSAGIAADREYVLDLLDTLTAEADRRAEAAELAGVRRFGELRQRLQLPRIVCVIENFPLLVAEQDAFALTAAARVAALARTARTCGIHLILTGIGVIDIGTSKGSGAPARDSVLGQFPVRVALPGGGSVLEPTNDSAAGLPLGSAVVNTAGGLGGPRGATRGHERMVRFPDPYAARGALAELRQRLWQARPDPGAPPPAVFAGYARPVLTNDPCYREALAGRSCGPAALLGRAVDVRRSTVSVPLGPAVGRHLVIVGPGAEAGELLVTAARSVAAHHAPGSARFVLAPLDPSAVLLADPLAADLARRHIVETVDEAGLLAAVESDSPGYLVLFAPAGAQPAGLSPERLRILLQHGPAAGKHLLGWWRTVAPLRMALDPTSGVEGLAAIAALDVPAAELTPLLGRSVKHWQPHSDRAMLWDGPDAQGTLLVPFASLGADDADDGVTTGSGVAERATEQPATEPAGQPGAAGKSEPAGQPGAAGHPEAAGQSEAAERREAAR